jgi:hypothetical protein
MCGASSQQTQLEGEQAAFYQTATQQATETFGEDQGLLASVKSVYDPILAAGPNQEGYSPEELEALNAQAVEGTATNYRNASKVLNEQQAAESGDTPLRTGAQEELQGELLGSAAEQESGQELQIKQSDYAQGNQNFESATNAELAVSGQYNPEAFESGATGAGTAAATTANEIAEEDNSWINAAIGAAGAIGGAVAGPHP